MLFRIKLFKSRFIAAIVNTLLASVGVHVLNLIAGVVLAHTLGPVGRGEIATVAAWPQFILWLMTMGFGHGLIYFWNQPADSVARRRLISGALWLSLAVGLPVALASQFIVDLLIPGYGGLVRSLTMLSLGLMPIAILIDYFGAALLAQEEITVYNLGRVSNSLFYTLAILVLYAFGRISVQTVGVASIIGASLPVLIYAWRLWKLELLNFDRKLQGLRRPFVYGLKVHSGIIPGLFNLKMDQLYVSRTLDAQMMGYYSVGYTMVSLLQTFASSVGLIVFPRASAKDGSEIPVITNALRATLGMALVGCGLFIATAPWALRLVYGSAFVGAAPAARILTVSAIFWSGVAVLTEGMKGLGHPWEGTLAQGIGTAGLFLLPRLVGLYGISGAASSTLVVYATAFFILLIRFSKLTRLGVMSILVPARSDWEELRRATFGTDQ